jgi:hypothetical protein
MAKNRLYALAYRWRWKKLYNIVQAIAICNLSLFFALYDNEKTEVPILF